MSRTIPSNMLSFVVWCWVASLYLTGVSGFVTPCSSSSRLRHQCRRRWERPLAVSEEVDRLLHLVQQPSHNSTTTQIREILPTLTIEQEENTTSSDAKNTTLFEKLLGNYNVSCTLPTKDSERPVGGKWNKLAQLEHSWQHILPSKVEGSVAQVINMIVLRVWASLAIHVILRGDAFAVTADQRQTPGGLSPRTVRVDFDPPRIILSGRKKPWLSWSLGPKSSVVLDTPYCDGRVRIGKGSRGSQFVFVRTTDPRADTWIDLMRAQKTLGKKSLLAMFGSLSGLLWWSQLRLCSGFIARWLILLPSAISSTLLTTLIVFSTGGIERDPPLQTR
eukprot:scaffold513_cov169-Amphora_coffeaeformis.AAC.8